MRRLQSVLLVWLYCIPTCVVSASAETNEVSEPFVGIRVIHRHATEPRPVDIWIAEVDPRADGVSFLVTPSNGDLPGDTTPETTRSFVTRVGAQIGINGSFFSVAGKAADGTMQYNVSGLSASKGDAYSPFARGYVDAINFSQWNVATMIHASGDKAAKSSTAIRPVDNTHSQKAPSKTAAIAARPADGEKKKKDEPKHVPGTIPQKTIEVNIGFEHEPTIPIYNALSGKCMLIEAGASVAPDEPDLHPRTAAGIEADGKILLITIDGRETGRSEGMKLSEVADVLIGLGAQQGLSFDGGGSTTFVMADPASAANDPQVKNLPCDPFSKANEGKEHGKERPVGNSLAVFARVKNTGDQR